MGLDFPEIPVLNQPAENPARTRAVQAPMRGAAYSLAILTLIAAPDFAESTEVAIGQLVGPPAPAFPLAPRAKSGILLVPSIVTGRFGRTARKPHSAG